ncbi:hypothetical protein BROC_01380 [Candidatus Brocadiaceae bacterium]|nr:hypothetical protein BROC_01380 [Candidatus Brocadiaceae bacterium]
MHESGTDPVAGQRFIEKSWTRETRPQSGACPPKEDRTFLWIGLILLQASAKGGINI